MQAIGKPLAGRRVLLTGASGGIGAATAQLLAGAGARLALLDRDEAALQSLAAGLPDAPAHLALALDLRDDAALDAAVHEVLARFGSVDVLINNAGVLVGGHAEQASAARVRELLDCNLYVPI
nr:SDR family NAD(P)-dependent oxidoreductase [Pseudomonadales bacterium]